MWSTPSAIFPRPGPPPLPPPPPAGRPAEAAAADLAVGAGRDTSLPRGGDQGVAAPAGGPGDPAEGSLRLPGRSLVLLCAGLSGRMAGWHRKLPSRMPGQPASVRRLRFQAASCTFFFKKQKIYVFSFSFFFFFFASEASRGGSYYVYTIKSKM